MSEISDKVVTFLSKGSQAGMLGFVARDGRPLVTPVWFFVDEDQLFLTTEAGSSKGRAMARDPRVVMCVADPNPPFSFVQIQGTATISEDRDETVATATRIGERYLGADSANEFGQSQGMNGEIMVRITPTKAINSVDLSD
jgi:PPOX class probable F420-dependent enzyme